MVAAFLLNINGFKAQTIRGASAHGLVLSLAQAEYTGPSILMAQTDISNTAKPDMVIRGLRLKHCQSLFWFSRRVFSLFLPCISRSLLRISLGDSLDDSAFFEQLPNGIVNIDLAVSMLLPSLFA
jgi:hypothetical protein